MLAGRDSPQVGTPGDMLTATSLNGGVSENQAYGYGPNRPKLHNLLRLLLYKQTRVPTKLIEKEVIHLLTHKWPKVTAVLICVVSQICRVNRLAYGMHICDIDACVERHCNLFLVPGIVFAGWNIRVVNLASD